MKKSLWQYLILTVASLGLLFFVHSEALALNSPEKVSTSSNFALAPTITTDSNGKVHMVWMDAPNSWGSSTINLLHSFWNGAVWSTPTIVASGDYNWLPSLASDTLGNVYLVWGTRDSIKYSTFNGTSWSAAVIISNPAAGFPWDPEIAIDSSGKPQVVYTVIPPGAINDQRSIYHTRWTGTAWTTPVNLSAAGITADQFPTITATANGKVHFIWKSQIDGTVIAGASRVVHRFWDGTSYSATNVVSGTIGAGKQPQPRVIADKNNNIHAIWEECDSTTSNCWDEVGPARVMYSKWNGTSWSAPFTVTSTAQQTLEQIPSLGVVADSTNNIYVGWIDRGFSPLKVGFRKFNNSSSAWEAAQTANTRLTSADFPAYTVDKWDNVHIAWGEINSATNKFDLIYDSVPFAFKVITSSGGSLTTFNGDTLTIPSGSLSSPTLISAQITPLSQPAPAGSNSLARQYFFEPAGTTFNPAIQVTFKYTDAEVVGIDERTLGVYVWDSTLNQWVFKTGTINRAQNTITISLSHFSIFGIFSPPDIVNWISPLKEEETRQFNGGSTIPIKFKFTTTISDQNQIKVQVVNDSGILLKEFVLGEGADNLRYDPVSQEYIANFQTKDLSLASYQVKVLYLGLLRDSLDFGLK